VTTTLRSPDGAIEVGFSEIELRMSLWVYEPVVTRTRDGRIVLSLDGTLWDAAEQASFPAPGLVALRLRHWPDGTTVVPVVLDVERETFAIGDDAEPDRPLRGIGQALRAARKALRGQADHS
jgi:hypothetical protein